MEIFRNPDWRHQSRILAVALVISVITFANTMSSEVFKRINIPGALTNCHGVSQHPHEGLSRCVIRWWKQRPSTQTRLLRFNSADETGGCAFVEWCDELSPNQTDSAVSFLSSNEHDFRMVLFSVKSGSQLRALDSFINPLGCNQSLMFATVSGPPPSHLWRSCWLDRLSDLMRLLPRKIISVEIVKNNATVLKINFDGSFAGLNLQNWFSQSRLVGSEPDLAMASRTYNIFSFIGAADSINSHNRTFYISTLHNGCPGDEGIVAVIEKADVCLWGKTGNDTTPLPRILYNIKAGVWENNNTELADHLMITV